MSAWPELPIAAWRDTCATLQLYSQVVGKVRLALTPRVNQWWNVPFYITTRGLGTSPMPYEDRLISVDFDFFDHAVRIQDSLGRSRVLTLEPRTVCDFHNAFFAELEALDVRVRIDPRPQECPVQVPFTEDRVHSSYDREWAQRFFRVLAHMEPAFQAFRARFRGKSSPVHFFWGSFDLALTRFNGRRAPPVKGFVERLSYDEEVISFGFWPGDAWNGKQDAAFYAYCRPQPAGLANERVVPASAEWNTGMSEFLLPYDAVQRARDPAAELLSFLRSTYDACAKRAGWDRETLAYP